MFGNEEGEQVISSADRRKSSYRAVLEKKLSIAERAVATNPCSITLQLERLKICQELLEPSVLAKEWKKLVGLGRVSVWGTLLGAGATQHFRWRELAQVCRCTDNEMCLCANIGLGDCAEFIHEQKHKMQVVP